MYQRIMVAVDGSDISRRALQEAIQLTRDMDARLVIVHVVDAVDINLAGDFGNFQEVVDATSRGGETLLEEAAATARAAGIEPETRLPVIDTLGQRVAERIVAEAESWPADLLVIGTHGRRGIHHLLLGSVAEGVVRTATRPVLLVRAP